MVDPRLSFYSSVVRRLTKKFWRDVLSLDDSCRLWGGLATRRLCGKNHPSILEPEISLKRTFRRGCRTGMENKLYLPWTNIACFHQSRRTVSLVSNRTFRLTRISPSPCLPLTLSPIHFLSNYNPTCITYRRCAPFCLPFKIRY